ncbi:MULTISPECIES: ABC transporter permease subunit, partial [unclassified Rhodococcus (in: high G+C Gram-positive bacteria)]
MTAATSTAEKAGNKGLAGLNPGIPVAAAIVVIMAVIYLVGGKDQGLVTQSVVSGLLLGGVYALISVGLTLIFGVLGIVNFAQGAMLTMAMYIVYALSTAGLPVYVATLV